MKPFMLMLVLIGFLSSCKKTEDQKNQAQELNSQFINAWNSKDSGKAISFLAEDVQFLQGDVQYRGRSEVSDKWITSTINTISNLKLNVVSSGTDEATAYEAGTFTVDVLPPAPGEAYGVGSGNYILLWKKDAEGNWKLSYAQLEDLPVRAGR